MNLNHFTLINKLVFLFRILPLVLASNSFSQCPDLIVDQGPDLVLCSGENFIYGGSPTINWSGDPNETIDVEWYNSNGNLVSTDQNPELSFPSNDTLTLVVTVGGCVDSSQVIVDVIAGPIAGIEVYDENNFPITTFTGDTIVFCSTSDAILTTSSSNTDPNTLHIIDWGNGISDTIISSNVTFANGQFFYYNFDFGFNNINYIVQNDDGCSDTISFNLYFGGVPFTTISQDNGLITSCSPQDVLYNIIQNSGDYDNSPSTQYLINFSDGSPTLYFTQANIPDSIIHVYDEGSCGELFQTNGTDYNNAFSIEVTSYNLCGQTSGEFGPFYVSIATQAEFSMDTIACINTPVDITNESYGGENVTANSCDTNYIFLWDIQPPNFTLSAGQSLGLTLPNGAIVSGSTEITPSFTSPGNYTVTLITDNNNTSSCDPDTVQHEICILPGLTANFVLPGDIFCIPGSIEINNTSAEEGCDVEIENLWSVNYTNTSGCEDLVDPNYEYVSGTSNQSQNPEIEFNAPGIFEITLSAQYEIAVDGLLCQPQTYIDTITVQSLPEITMTSGDTLCEDATVSPTATLNTCYDPNTTYLWTFDQNGGTTTTINNSLTPSITYIEPGIYNYSFEATNSCGTEILNSLYQIDQEVIVTVNPDVNECINTQININGSITGALTTGVWSADVPGGVFGDPFNLSTTYTPPLNYVGVVNITLTSDDPVGPCPAIPATFVYTIFDAADVVAPDSLFICEGSPVFLDGILQGAASFGYWNDQGAGGVFSNVNTSTGDANYTAPNNVDEVWLYLESDVPSVQCPMDTDSTLLTIYDIPVVVPMPNVTLCNGELTSLISFTGDATGFSWTNSDPSIGLAASGVGDILPFTGINTSSTQVVSSITVTPEYTANGVTCLGTPISFNILINPTPVIDPTLDQTICALTNTQAITFSGTPPGSTFSWVNDNTSTGLGASGVGNIASFSGQNSGLTPITSEVIVSPELNTCVGLSDTFTITINPIPVIDPIAPIEVCNGDLVDVLFSGSGTEYTWVNDNVLTGLSASGTGDISFTSSNGGNVIEVSTVTVTPSFILNGVSCSGAPLDFTITVNPTPIVDPVSDQEICANDQTVDVNFTSNVSGTTFSWVNDNNTIGLGLSGNGDISSFTGLNSSNNNNIGQIVVTPTANGCIGPTTPFNITVNPIPSVTNISLDQTVCSQDLTTEVLWTSDVVGTTFSWTGVLTSGTANGFTATGNGLLPAMTIDNPGATPAVITYTVTPSFSGCDGLPVDYIITVNPIPVLSPIAPETICGGSAFTTPLLSSNVSGTTYSWQLLNTGSVPATISGYQLSGTGDIVGQVINNTGSTPYTLEYEIVPSANGCDGLPEIFSLTINPAPDVIFDISDQTICSGDQTQLVQLSSSTPGATFTWDVVSVGPDISGASPTQGVDQIPVFTLTNTAIVEQTVEISATASTSGNAACPGTQATYIITVNPVPTVDIPTDIIVCNGELTSLISFTGDATGFSWTNSDPSIGLAASGVGDILPFTGINTSSTQVVSSITITPEYTANGVTCLGNQVVFSVTINPSPIVDPVNDQEICINDFSNEVFFSGTGTTYFWFNDNLSTGLGANGIGNLPSFQGLNSTSQQNISNIGVYAESLGCLGDTTEFMVIVNPTTGVLPISDFALCNGEVSDTIFIQGTASSYNWNNSNTNIGLALNGTGNILPFQAQNTTINDLIGTVTVTPIFVGGSSSCPGDAITFDITVNSDPVIDPIMDQTVCNGGATQVINFTGLNFDQVDWVNDNASIGLQSTGNGNILSFNASNTGSNPEIANITATPSETINGITCFGNPVTFQIVVNPSPSVDLVSDTTVCSGSNIGPIVFTGNANEFNWTNDNTNIGLSASGQGNINVFTATNTSSNNTIFSNVTVSPEYIGGGLSCPGVPMTFEIAVNPIPNVDPIADQELCAGELSSLVTFNGLSTSFDWTNNESGTGLSAVGAGDILPFNSTNSGGVPLVSTVTVQPVFAANGLTCTGTPEVFSITVNPAPTIDLVSDTIVCSGSNIGPIVFTGNANEFNWTNDNTNIGLSASGQGNIIVFTATNTSSNNTIFSNLTVSPEYVGGNSSCPGIPMTFEIAVNPIPNIDPIADQEICAGNQTQLVNFTGLATSYEWVNNNSFTGLDSNGIGDIQPFTGINNGTNPEVSNIIIQPIFNSNGLQCNGVSEQFTISVNPTATVDPITDIVVCNGDIISSVIFTGTATNFEWLNSDPSIGLSSSGSGNLPTFMAVNNNSSPVTVTIAVTPSYNSAGAACAGAIEFFTITVNPTPTVDPIQDLVVCNGNSTSEIIFTGTGTIYDWTNDNASIGIGLTGLGNIPQFVAQNSTNTISNATIIVTPSAVGCTGQPESFQIIINPTPFVDPVSDQMYCDGEITLLTQFTGNYSSLDWTNSNTTIGLALNGFGDILPFTASNGSNSQQNIGTVILTPYFLNQGIECAGLTEEFDIIVNPIPIVDPFASFTVCHDDIVPDIIFSGTGTQYSWNSNNTGVGMQAAGIDIIQSFTAFNIGVSQEVANVTVIPEYWVAGNLECSGSPQVFTIAVNPKPFVDPIADPVLCNGDNLDLTLSATVNSTFNWNAIDNQDVSGETLFNQFSPFIIDTLLNNSSTIQIVAYNVIPTSSPEGCSGDTYSFNTIVIPDVLMTSQTSIEICSGVSASVQLTANVPSTFTWFATDNPNVTGENTIIQSGNVISDVLINNTTQTQIIVYTVIPTSIQGGCVGTPQTVTVLVLPPLALISPNSTIICSGDNVDLELEANVPSQFNWFAQPNFNVNGESLTAQNSNLIDDVLINNTSSQEVVIYNAVATSLANGCSSPTFDIIVYVNPLPLPQSSLAEICSGENVNLALQANMSSTFSWYADPNINVTGESTSIQNSSTISDLLINNTGVDQIVYYNVTAISSPEGCVGAEITIPVIVHPLPEVDFIVDSALNCENAIVSLTNLSEPGLNLTWDYGDGTVITGSNPLYAYDDIGTYTITLTGVDPVTGCQNSASQILYIEEAPAVSFTVDHNEGCIPDEFIFTGATNDPLSSYYWDFGNGETSNQSGSIDITYDIQGCYDVELIITNPIGCSSSLLQEDIVCVYNWPYASFDMEESLVYTDDPTVYFNNNSINSDYYIWNFGDGDTSFATNPIHVYPSDPGEYQVILTAFNEFGCSDQYALNVIVYEDDIFYVPNTFTPNYDGTNEFFKPVITAGFDRSTYRLLIFNRWGEVVFESCDPDVGWDGSYGVGQYYPVQDGTYTWKITLRMLQDENAKIYTGHVNVLR